MQTVRILFTALLLACTTTTASAKHTKAIETTPREVLMDYFKSIYGKQTLSGAMANVNWNTNEADWVYRLTGAYPVINSFDFIHHFSSKPGGWIDYSNATTAEQWYESGGIVAALWHWNVPAKAAGQYAFYTKDTDFDVRKVFDRESAEYALMIHDIDQIASFLKPLCEKGIPVIWRPLHEAGGRWFWWGVDPEGCKELWRIMHERFDQAGLNNLVWTWTHATEWNKPFEDGLRWYPGDEYVDIVGIDIYNVKDPLVCKDYFMKMEQYYPGKMVALTECGNVPSIGSQWEAGARWLFFMPWYDYGRTRDMKSPASWESTHQHCNITWWREAWQHNYVIQKHGVKTR